MSISLTTIAYLLFFTVGQAFSQTTPIEQNICAGSTKTYKVKDPTNKSTFKWEVTAGTGTITKGQNSAEIEVKWETTQGSGVLSVTETNVAGCTGEKTEVTVNRKTAPTAEFDNSKLCNGEELNVKLTGEAPWEVTYTYKNNAKTTVISDTPTYSLGKEPGKYLLIGVSDKSTCSNTTTTNNTAVIGAPLKKLEILLD